MPRTRLIAAAICLLSAAPAHAATYDWSYVFGSGTQTLSGVIDGTPDNSSVTATSSVIDVSAIYDVQLNGIDFGAPLTPVNNERWWYGAVLTPTVTLDGSEINLCVSEIAPCATNGFMFNVAVSSSLLEFAFFLSEDRTLNYPGFGSFDTFVPENWSMVARTATVPVPAGLGLLLMALGGLVALRRRT